MLLLAVLFAFTPDASAWKHCFLRGADSDYDAGKRVYLTWNKDQYEGTLVVDADSWKCQINSADDDDAYLQWFGPDEAKTVTGDTNFGVSSSNRKDITFKQGTYSIYVKTNGNNEGDTPNHIYIVKESTPTYRYYLHAWKSGESGKDIRLTPGSYVSYNDLDGWEFGISVKEDKDNGSQKFWYRSNNSSDSQITTGTKTFNLVEESFKNSGNMKLSAGSGTYKFKLTLGKENMPTSLEVVSPNGSSPSSGVTYALHPWDGYSTDISLTPGVPKTVTDFKNCKFGIQYLENGKQTAWYRAVGENEVRAGTATTYTLGKESDSNKNFNNTAGDGSYTFTLTTNSEGIPTALKVETPNDTPEPDNNIFVIGDFSYIGLTKDWDNGFTTKTVGDKYEYKFTPAKSGNVYFRIKVDGKQYGPKNNDVTIATDGIHNDSPVPEDVDAVNGKKSYTFKANAATEYTITYWTNYNGNKRVSVASNEPNNYYLAAGFLNDWSKTDRILFEPKGGNEKVLVVKTKYGETNPGNKGFKITTKPNTDDGTWYSIGGNTPLDKGDHNIKGKTEDPNMKLARGAYNKIVTFTLTLGEDNKPLTLNVDWDGDAYEITNNMPVYPIGVYDDEQFARYDQWPVMYLLSTVLNNDQITPEYQMNKVSDTRYELEFTLRNTYTENDKWEGGQHLMYVKGFDNTAAKATLKTGNDGYVTVNLPKKWYKDGARYKAVCEKGSGDIWKLSVEQVGDYNDMPFLSMIGEKWNQRAQANTPYNNYNSKNTGSGFQEAWIQYDSRGKVLLNRKGQVMYNTMWPPRNPILFKTSFKLNESDENEKPKDFTLTSKDLTFVKVEKKKGSEWKSDPMFAKYTKATYNGKQVYDKKLALEDNTEYTLYRVSDMWINGRVKIWTGWGGVTGTNSHANWSWHSNWGHYNKSTDSTEIPAESTIALSTQNGDMQFNKPTFFKYVDFFYCNEDPGQTEHTNSGAQDGRSVLFTELATGGAQIAAISTNEYSVGNYQASLEHISNVLDSNVLSVVIDCYTTISDGKTQKEEMVANTVNWTGSINVKDFHTLFASKDGNIYLPGDGSTDNKTYSRAKWVKDPKKFESGDYFYRMTVVLKDNNNNEETIVVDSNPFTIFSAEENLTLNVYQLVKIEDIPASSSVSGKPEGHYVTYKGESVEHPEIPTFPVYELWIENDDKFDVESSNIKYDANGKPIGYIDDTDFKYRYVSLNKMPNYKTYEDVQFGHTYFTDKVLVVGSKPTCDVVNGYKANVKDVTPASSSNSANGPMKAPANEEWDLSRMQPEYGNRYMYVTNVGTFNQRQFDLTMKYNKSFIDAKTQQLIEYKDKEASAEPAKYQAVIPEPILKQAEVQVYYGADNTDGTNADTKDFYYPDKNTGLKLANARYTNVRDYIEVEYPNVSTFMHKRIVAENVFSLQLDYADPNKAASTWDNIYKFGLPEGDDATGEQANNSAVVLSNPMKPQIFNNLREMKLIKDETKGYAYYDRGWNDISLQAVTVTDNAPDNFNHSIVNLDYNTDFDGETPISGSAYTYGENNHIYSKYTFTLKHKASVKSDDELTGDQKHPDLYETNPEDGHNYAYHNQTDENGEVIKYESNVPKEHYHHLRHLGSNDYYYVAIIDYPDASNLGEESDLDLQEYIVNGGEKTVNGKTEKYMFTVKSKADASLDLLQHPNKLHFVVPATHLMNGNEVTVELKKDYGEWSPDFQTDAEKQAYIDKLAEINENHFSKNIRVLISYLYPFYEVQENTTPSTDEGPANGPLRAVKDYTGDVLKSKAKIWDASLGEGSNIVTDVNSLYNDDSFGGVKVGAGYIDVDGVGVQVVNAAGMVIGEGAGRYDVNSGVYVVRYNGKTTKVVVK